MFYPVHVASVWQMHGIGKFASTSCLIDIFLVFIDNWEKQIFHLLGNGAENLFLAEGKLK